VIFKITGFCILLASWRVGWLNCIILYVRGTMNTVSSFIFMKEKISDLMDKDTD